MSMVGMMPMPRNFRYKDVFLKGRPKHETFDAFCLKHPKMDVGKRAKIFAPFDALKGFNEAVSSKDVLYVEQVLLEREDQEELNRRLNILKEFACNSRRAKQNHIQVTVIYFEPCSDKNNEAYLSRGQYKTITGICMNVDPEVTHTVLVNQTRILLDRILAIESDVIFAEKEVSEESFWGS